MDAQELSQTLTRVTPEVNTLSAVPSLTDQPVTDCAVAATVSCRWKCALEVIDGLLGMPRASVSGEEVDLLLDLRWQLRQRTEAEMALRLFCDLRRRMERRHYLAFFRLRRWLENQVVAEVRVCPAAEIRVEAVRLDHYCVEAVRRVCLCAEPGAGGVFARAAFAVPVSPGGGAGASRRLRSVVGRAHRLPSRGVFHCSLAGASAILSAGGPPALQKRCGADS